MTVCLCYKVVDGTGTCFSTRSVTTSLTETWRVCGFSFAADKDFLLKQQEVLRLFTKVHEPNRFKEQRDLGAAYEPLNNLQRYKVCEALSPHYVLERLYGFRSTVTDDYCTSSAFSVLNP